MFKLSEDTNSNEVAWGLRELERTYEQMSEEARKWEEERKAEGAAAAARKKSWWRPW